MPPPTDPAALTPDERFRELARLLAVGLLRLAQPLPSPESTPVLIPQKSPDSLANELAVSGEKSVTGHAG